jgi:hypothetical protein
MKKNILLLFGWLFLAVPVAVQAQFIYSTSSGAVTITGYTGLGGDVTIPSTIDGVPVTSIGIFAFTGCSSITSVTIPNGVILIGTGAFDACTNMTSVTLPSTVSSIGEYAFSNCLKLTAISVDAQDSFYSSVDGVLFDKNKTTLIQYPGGMGGSYAIPSSVTTIEASALSACSGLTSVTIPSSVTSIGSQAFTDCSNLTALTVDSQNPSYSSVNGVMFDKSQATLLQYPGGVSGNYTIPSSVAKIGDYAFAMDARLTGITIPNSVTSLGTEAFGYCTGLSSVSLPNRIASIGESAFSGCSRLTSMPIPSSVASIGVWAFQGCSGLTGVAIPASVTSIGVGVFDSCSSLTAITVDPQNPSYSSVNGVLFDKSQATLVEYPDGLSGSYVIPSGVSVITAAAFNGCTGLTSVTIPGSVTNISSQAFISCPNLTGAFFQGNAPTANASSFTNDSNLTTVYYLPGTTGWGATFAGKTASLIPEGDRAIIVCASPSAGGTASGGGIYASGSSQTVTATANSGYLFTNWTENGSVVSSTSSYIFTLTDNRNLLANFTIDPASEFTVLVVGGGVTITGYTGPGGAVTIPSTINGLPVGTIGTSAFEGNTSLTSVTIPDSVTYISDRAFYGCTGLTGVAFIPPSKVLIIGDYAFAGCENLTNVTIPDSVGRIGVDAFCACTSLNSVTVGVSVRTIGAGAFGGCTSLATITIPASVASIGEGAFAGCSSLAAIEVDPGNSAYASVAGVLFSKDQTTLIQYPAGNGGTSYVIPDGVTDLGEMAFQYCTDLISVTIPRSVTAIPVDAFAACTSLASVTIPDSVTGIGNGAFIGCTALTSIVIPKSVTSIGGDAFFFCTSLKAINFQGNAPSADSTVFTGDSNLDAVYYLPGTTGWGATFAGVPAIEQSVPVITWLAPVPITYGTALSSAQLDAEANVPGTFVYTPAAGTVLNAGTQILSATFTPADTNTYAVAAVTQNITVVSANYPSFLQQLFPLVLGRQIDSGALSAYAAAMSGGQTRLQVYSSLTSSSEYGAWQIEPAIRLYYAALARMPDYAGLQNWSANLHAGVLTLTGAADQFAGSDEFLLKYGSLDNTGYVQQLYRNVLGREADPSGLADWVGRLNGGASRGTVLVGFSESPEFQADMANQVEIVRLYFLLKQRMPTAAELQSWIGFLNGEDQTDTLFALGYPSGLADSDYVQLVFQGFLRRPVDSGALSTFGSALTAGTVTHGSLVNTLLSSTEFSTVVGPVSRLYMAAFRRVPDVGGLDNWVAYVRGGNPLQSAADAFVASPEFQLTYGSLNDTQYVTLLYENVLGRDPDPTGLATWTGDLGSGWTRGQVLIGFSESQEGIRLFAPTVRTFLHYFTFLNATPTSADLDYWKNYLATLDDQMRETFLDGLGASD